MINEHACGSKPNRNHKKDSQVLYLRCCDQNNFVNVSRLRLSPSHKMNSIIVAQVLKNLNCRPQSDFIRHS